jgi:uncharacterized membrane protein HdeD (DUF308 family)
MGAFNTHGTKLLGLVLALVVLAQGVTTITAASRDNPKTQQDQVEQGVSVILILFALWIAFKTFRAL